MTLTLTQEELKKILSYNPETGVFAWTATVARNVKAGKIAGSLNDKGYRQIQIKGKRYMAHRLVFLYMTGALPPEDVDHKNHNPDDNSWDNIRLATRSENSMNRHKALKSNCTSQYKGVTWAEYRKKWRSYIVAEGKNKYLGSFNTEIEAALAYNKASEDYFGEFGYVNEVKSYA